MTATVPATALLAADYTALIWTGVYLAGALLLGAIVIAAFSKWFRRDVSDTLSASDQLAQFRSMYEKGELSEDEFNRLRAKLGSELRRDLGAPVTTPALPAEDLARSPVSTQTAPGAQVPQEPPPETGITPG